MTDDKILKDAQYRKGLSIAFFNATNAAIALVASDDRLRRDEKSMFESVTKIRNFFLEEHKEYYANTIAKVGANYKADETIKRLKECTTLEELHRLFISISEDERRDGEIRKCVGELKAKLK